MIIAPDHVASFCINSKSGDSTLRLLRDKYEGELSYVYKIKCTCGEEKFLVYKDDHPTIIAKCSRCMKRITVYDLAFYPTACKLKDSFELHKILDDEVELYVNYEYSDDFIIDGMELDPNDITWAKAFIVKDGAIHMILDDETA